MGKSSSLNRVLSNFPQVIGHYEYKDKKFVFTKWSG